MGKFINGQVLGNGQVLAHGSWLRLAQGRGLPQEALDLGSPGVGALRADSTPVAGPGPGPASAMSHEP